MQRKTLQADKSTRAECLPRQNCVVYFKRRSGYHSEHTTSFCLTSGGKINAYNFYLSLK